MRSKGQISVEFFLLMGLVLLAVGVWISSSETQIKGTRTLNNIALARNVLDSQVSAIHYAYLSGANTKITQKAFVPANVSCMNWNATSSKLYCLAGGHTSTVNSRQVIAPITVSVQDTRCYQSGWITFVANNTNGTNVSITCS